MRDTIALALVRAELCRLYAEKQPRPVSRRAGRLLPGLLRKASLLCKAGRLGARRKALSPSE